MKIASAAIALQGQHTATLARQESASLKAWTRQAESALASAIAHISDAARGAQALPPPPPLPVPDAGMDATDNDPVLSLIRGMVEMLTGQPLKLFSPRALGTASTPVPLQPPQSAPQPRPSAGPGLEYDFRVVTEETQIARFSAQGQIRTSDGLEIDFKLDLAMAYYHREESELHLRAGEPRRIDPLVINFAGTAAQLTERTFRFDLDANGRDEKVPLLAGGSGYLALDLNLNGRIDNGNELFGPATGDGFAALARHDEDGNGWIDENDAIFAKLKIWTPASDGDGSVEGLAARGVGALYLGRVATPFELRGSGNSLGEIKETGLYLDASGRAGTLQEVDLTV